MPFDLATTVFFALAGVVAVLLWMQYAREIAASLFGKADRADYDAELARRLEEALKRRNAPNAAPAPDRPHARLAEPPSFAIERVVQKPGLCILQIRNTGGTLHAVQAESSMPASVSPANLGPSQTAQIVFSEVPPPTHQIPFVLYYTDDSGTSQAAGWVLDLKTQHLLPARAHDKLRNQ